MFLPCGFFFFGAPGEFQASCSDAEETDTNEQERNAFSPHLQFGEGNVNYVPKHLFTL